MEWVQCDLGGAGTRNMAEGIRAAGCGAVRVPTVIEEQQRRGQGRGWGEWQWRRSGICDMA